MRSSVHCHLSLYISVSYQPQRDYKPLTHAKSVYPETRGVPLEEMDKLFGDESDEDEGDSDFDEAEEAESEVSSLISNPRHRRRSASSSLRPSLPTSRKSSPMPSREAPSGRGLFGRITDSVNGLLGSAKRQNRSVGYTAVNEE